MKTAADFRAERIRLHREMADVYRQSGLPEKAVIEDATADCLAGEHPWVSLRELCMRDDPQVCPRCGAKQLIRTPEETNDLEGVDHP